MKTISFKLLVILSFACKSVFAQTNEELATQAYKAMQADKNEEAITLSEKVLQSDPTNTKAAYVLGFANFQVKKYPQAEKYLLMVEEVKKDDAGLYTALGVSYYANRAQKHLLDDLNTSLDYFAKSIALNPKPYGAYFYRFRMLYDFGGLNSRPKLKEIFYSDSRMMMQLFPDDLDLKFAYAKASYELFDYGQALPVFAALMASPKVTKEVSDVICANAIRYVEDADSEARLVKKIHNPTLWSDAILLMKGCKNAAAKFETDDTRKKKQVSKFREKVILYYQNKSSYLKSPEYVAEVSEAINAGDTRFLSNRIEIYTSQNQLALADADRKKKLIAEEKDLLDRLIAEEKQMRYAEENFKKGEALNSEDFKTLLGMKKSRLKLLDRIIALNVPQGDKDVIAARRIKLADVINKGEEDVARVQVKIEANNNQQNRDAGSIQKYNEAVEEALRLFKIVAARVTSLDDCKMVIDDYKKKCVREKLEFNKRDLENSLYYVKEARRHAESITGYETKRNFLDQASKIITTIENSISSNEKALSDSGG